MCLYLKSINAAAIRREREMTKTELLVALAQSTQTEKKTAGAFLHTLSTLAYKETKKNGEFVLPGFGKLVKQKRKARTCFNPKTQQKIKIPAKTVVKFRVAKAATDAVLGGKEVVQILVLFVVELFHYRPLGNLVCKGDSSYLWVLASSAPPHRRSFSQTFRPCAGAASYSGGYRSKMVLPPRPVHRDFQLVVPKEVGFGVTVDEEKLALYRRGRS
jgi:DNA-binding protein HU-beta